MPSVMLRSVVGTTFEVLEAGLVADQRQQIHRHAASMKLNSRIQQKMVSASGAISLLVPWKVSRTWRVDEIDHHFDEQLELARHADRGLARRQVEGNR